MRRIGAHAKYDAGFSLLEILIAMVILTGAFITITGIFPLSGLMHRTALEREIAMSLAQYQMEFFLANPGPFPGNTGTTANFANAAKFPSGYTGYYAASSLVAGGGLTLIVVRVTPPHTTKVEISAVDTSFSNFAP